jgi:hypothetical protein
MIAQRNQVFFGIAPGMAAKLLVMDFEILRGSAVLATPTVSLEHDQFQLSIRLGLAEFSDLSERS